MFVFTKWSGGTCKRLGVGGTEAQVNIPALPSDEVAALRSTRLALGGVDLVSHGSVACVLIFRFGHRTQTKGGYTSGGRCQPGVDQKGKKFEDPVGHGLGR